MMTTASTLSAIPGGPDAQWACIWMKVDRMFSVCALTREGGLDGVGPMCG
jgi:hypothetical protein